MSASPRTATAASIAHHVDALPPGTRLGEFEVLALLGVGGFGMVYQAFDHSLLRFVAIKEYMPAALAGRADGQSLWVRSSSDEQSFQAGLASFVGEARLLAQFDHPSLVKVFRFWEANHTAYMVMPLYSGMTLKQARAHMRTPPPEAWLRKVLWSVTSALRVLHEGQTLHRDISPDNIFLQDMGPPVLLDLGAARHAIGDTAQRLTSVLKVNYAPIEQYTDAGSQLPQGPWSDLYSLGAVVHGCLCNDTPLPATLRAIRDRMVPFSRVARTVRKQFGVEYSRPFVEAVSHCLALQPHDRPQSIDAFLQTMDMTSAPAGLEHFDFRAELGDVWVEPASKDAQGVASAVVIDLSLLSQPYPPQPLAEAILPPPAPAPAAAPVAPAFAETVAADWDTTVFADTRNLALEADEPPASSPAPRRGQAAAGPAPAPAAARAQDGRAARSAPAGRVRLPWVMAGSLAVLVLLGAWWTRAPKPRYTPESEIITELAPRPAPVAALPEPVAPLAEAASAPAEGGAGAAAGAAASDPTAAGLGAAAAKARPPARRVAEPPAPAPAPAAPPPAQPAPLPEPRVPASRPAVAARPAGPEEACASASFLARPLCIHQQCQSAALAQHPVCVAARRQQEERALQQQLYPQ